MKKSTEIFILCCAILLVQLNPNCAGGNEDDSDISSSNDDHSEHERSDLPSSLEDADENFEEENNFSKQTYIEKYGVPEGCVMKSNPQSACQYYVEISKELEDTGELHFELVGKVPPSGGYVAVGLSRDRLMGNDHIVECIKLEDGRTTYHHSWSRAQTDPSRLASNPSIIKMEDSYPRYEDGILTCKFKRPINTYVEAEGNLHRFDLVHGKYYVIMAIGPLSRTKSDYIGFHGLKPLESGAAFAASVLLGHKENDRPNHWTDHDNHEYSGDKKRPNQYEKNQAQKVFLTPQYMLLLLLFFVNHIIDI